VVRAVSKCSTDSYVTRTVQSRFAEHKFVCRMVQLDTQVITLRWNFECSKNTPTLATASPNAWRRTQLPSMAFHRTTCREELRCFKNVRTLSATTSFGICIKESYSKLKFDTSTVLRPIIKASQPTVKDMLNGVGCAISALRTSHCGFDRQRGLVIVCSFSASEEVVTSISQSGGKTAADIARIIIRP
jgi:hypothetical protein